MPDLPKSRKEAAHAILNRVNELAPNSNYFVTGKDFTLMFNLTVALLEHLEAEHAALLEVAQRGN